MKIATIEGHHLISLNTPEALMLLRLLQSARLHGPTAPEQDRAGEVDQFYRELTASLMHRSSNDLEAGANRAWALPVQKKSFGID
ncbi:MAG: hypothetical protein ACKO5M_02235 [Vulcanococcus sp.]